MASLFDTRIASVADIDGSIMVGAKLYWYAMGTSTPKNTYSDSALTTPNTNPVVANGAGRFPSIWLDDRGYKFILTTADGDPTAPLVTQDEVGLVVNPSQIDVGDYGVIGDGSTDDTAAMLRVATAVNALTRGAAVYLGHRQIKISANITFTKPCNLIGDNHLASRIICYSNARIIMDGGTPADYTGPSFGVENAGIETDGIHTSSPLRIQYNTGGSGLPGSINITASHISGRNSTSGFAAGVELHNTGFAKFNNVYVLGDRDGTTGPGSSCASAYGIRMTGDGGSASFHQTRVYFCIEHISIAGNIEGVIFNDCELVAGLRGIIFNDTTDGFQPFYTVVNTHINVEEACVKLSGSSEFNIGQGCDFYGQGWNGTGNGTWTAVDITPTTATGSINCNGKIGGLFIQGDSHYAATAIGVRVRGVASPIEIYTIDNVTFQSVDTGIQLDAGTDHVRIGLANSYNNVTTPIDDAGLNNSIIYQGLDGNIGIGTSSPDEKFHVAGAVKTDTFFVLSNDAVIAAGSSSPEGGFAAPVASLYLTPSAIYRKATGSGNTGWVAI